MERQYDKYGRKCTDKTCVLCAHYGSIFEFDCRWYKNQNVYVCWSCVGKIIRSALEPRYPVPAKPIDVSCTLTDLLWAYYDAPLEWWVAEKPNVSFM